MVLNITPNPLPLLGKPALFGGARELMAGGGAREELDGGRKEPRRPACGVCPSAPTWLLRRPGLNWTSSPRWLQL